MNANRMKAVLATLALFVTVASAADAGDRRDDRGRGYHRVENSRWDRQGDGRRNRPAEIDRQTGVSGFILRAPRFGDFYGGAITAYRLAGLGTYFLRDYWPVSARNQVVLAPKAKIINVEQAMRGNAFASQACAFEAGVCIIRGGN